MYKKPEIKEQFDKLFQVIENEPSKDKNYVDFQIWKLSLLYDELKTYIYEQKGIIKKEGK